MSNNSEPTYYILSDETLNELLDSSAAIFRTFLPEKLAEIFQVNPQTIGRQPTKQTIKTLGQQLYKNGQLKRLVVAATKASQATPEMIGHLCDLASILLNASYGDWAYHLYRRAWQISQTVWGNEHIEVAQQISNMSGALYAMDKPQEALELGREALQLARQVQPNLDARKALIENNLASMLYDQQQFQEAFDLYHDAYMGRVKLLGHTHPDTISTMKSMGVLLFHVNHLQDSLPYLEKAFLAQNYVLGIQNAETLQTLNDLLHVFKTAAETTNDSSFLERAKPYQQALQLAITGS